MFRMLEVKHWFLPIVVVGIIIILALSANNRLGNRSASVVVIGASAISEQDISYKIAVEKAYGSDITSGMALMGLVNDTIEYEVSSLHSSLPTDEEIMALKKHIDETSKAPDVLLKVKAVFGNNTASYDRIYIMPKAVNYKLRAYFSRDKEIHKEERQKIEAARVLVFNGAYFSDAATKYGLKYAETSMADYVTGGRLADGKNLPPELQKYFTAEMFEGESPLPTILEKMSEGEIYKDIVEDDYSFKIVRLIRKSDYQIETIEASKRSFDDWLHEETKRFDISIKDEKLKKATVSDYSAVWWVGLMK